MVTVENTDVCYACGEEITYEFDCRTGEYTKMTMCACDRYSHDAEVFLKKRGLFEEFKKFHEELEAERKEDSSWVVGRWDKTCGRLSSPCWKARG
jgi:hypothetical protein